MSIRALPTETGEGPFPVVMCLLDVTERHAAAELLRFEARHDHATGLANRNLVLETIGELLATPDMPVGVLFIDLDRFKMVNDSLGHDAGDAVLRTIARRLAYEAPARSTVGRLAGDEFIIVLPDATVEDAQALGVRLLARLGEPVRIMRRDLVVTGSIGIVVTEPGVGQGVRGRKDVGATDVLRDADVAMYYAKQHGRNRLATFDERFRRRAIDRLALEEELRHGLAVGEVHPVYQPIVALEHAGHGCRRGTRPLDSPAAGHGAADGVHPDRRGDGAHRSAGPADAGAGDPAGRDVASRPAGSPTSSCRSTSRRASSPTRMSPTG